MVNFSAPMVSFFRMALRAAAALLVLGSGVAAAQEHELLGRHTDWYAYRLVEGGETICYIATQPSRAEGNYAQRGDVVAQVTHYPSESAFGVFSVIAGYSYGSESVPVVTVDGANRFELFTQGETAFAFENDDGALVQAMRRGLQMVVQGTSARGTLTTDTYSLRGFTAAINAINQACNRG